MHVIAFIRSKLEYRCIVWRINLTNDNQSYFERIQKCTFSDSRIILLNLVRQGLAGILETEFAENLNKIPAAAILGSGEMVEVTTKRAKYTADQVIATVPLGVLKADHEVCSHKIWMRRK